MGRHQLRQLTRRSEKHQRICKDTREAQAMHRHALLDGSPLQVAARETDSEMAESPLALRRRQTPSTAQPEWELVASGLQSTPLCRRSDSPAHTHVRSTARRANLAIRRYATFLCLLRSSAPAILSLNRFSVV